MKDKSRERNAKGLRPKYRELGRGRKIEKINWKKHAEHFGVERAELLGLREGRLKMKWMRANDDRAH